MTPDECSTELHLREISGYCDLEYQVIFMVETVGWIIRDSSSNDPKCWSWIIQIGHPWPSQFIGYEISLEAAKAAFRAVWLPAFDAVTLEQFKARTSEHGSGKSGTAGGRNLPLKIRSHAIIFSASATEGEIR
jgi:hypothetical protein